MSNNINIDELMKIIKDINIIDIRDKEDYNNGFIPGSINIPYNELYLNYKKYLHEYETYYIYCYGGSTSMKLCNHLNNLGYDTININGGYNAYKKGV